MLDSPSPSGCPVCPDAGFPGGASPGPSAAGAYALKPAPQWRIRCKIEKYRNPLKSVEIEMVTLHPSILERDGKKAFAVLPYEEFAKN